MTPKVYFFRTPPSQPKLTSPNLMNGARQSVTSGLATSMATIRVPLDSRGPLKGLLERSQPLMATPFTRYQGPVDLALEVYSLGIRRACQQMRIAAPLRDRLSVLRVKWTRRQGPTLARFCDLNNTTVQMLSSPMTRSHEPKASSERQLSIFAFTREINIQREHRRHECAMGPVYHQCDNNVHANFPGITGCDAESPPSMHIFCPLI